jgi:NAD(P)-dependent dehydrogenase (short-subunit alcohol dehydrogenase family)
METQIMSTTIESPTNRDVPGHAESHTNGQPINNNCKRLAHKVAVITGGSTGMGLATARQFLREGMEHVFITGRRKDALDQAVAEIGENVTAVQGDVATLSDLDRLYDAVKKQSRKIDVIFANAGIAQLSPFTSVDEGFYDLHFDANVKGLFFAVQKGLPLMNDGGAIILTGSIADIKGFPSVSVYSATKAAVRSFARTWTNELRDRRIRVNTISPGYIDTPILDSWQQGAALTKLKDDLAQNVPLGRLGESDEIARAVSFLASDEASYITGIELYVDGGVAQV